MKQSTVRRIISIVLLMLLMVLFSLTSEYFLTVRNIFTILREASVVGIVAVGMTFVIITAGIDLSVGAIMAVVAMVCANLFRFTPLPTIVILLIGVVVGVVFGMINGLIITKLNVPDFIAVLATMGIYRGLTLLIAIKENGFLANSLIKDKAFRSLGGDVNGLYYVTIAFFIVAVVGHIILKHTKLGTYAYAVGSNLKSAILSGIRHKNIKLYVYTICGFCCATGAIFTSARMGTATPDLGLGFEFDVIAAVVVGGASFNGGRGDIIGTVIGTLFMAVLNNGIYKFEVPAAYQFIVKGGIILLVVVFDAWYQKQHEKRLAQKPKEQIAGSAGGMA